MLSYVENDIYFMSMEMCKDGNCIIILRKKIDKDHGERIYTHPCFERSKKQDFAIYYDLEERIKNNTLDEEYIASL